MGGLDPAARLRLRAALQRRTGAGTTVLFTTHRLADAELLADRVAFLAAGHVAAAGTPAELCSRFAAPDLEHAFVHGVGAAAVTDS